MEQQTTPEERKVIILNQLQEFIKNEDFVGLTKYRRSKSTYSFTMGIAIDLGYFTEIKKSAMGEAGIYKSNVQEFTTEHGRAILDVFNKKYGPNRKSKKNKKSPSSKAQSENGQVESENLPPQPEITSFEQIKEPERINFPMPSARTKEPENSLRSFELVLIWYFFKIKITW
jgi:hypothetical protein